MSSNKPSETSVGKNSLEPLFFNRNDLILFVRLAIRNVTLLPLEKRVEARELFLDELKRLESGAPIILEKD